MLETSLAETPFEPSTAEPSRPMRILVIDDNELDRQRLIRLCGQTGLSFDATQVERLDQIGPALDETRFDIIFIDYYLAGDTGLDALEILTQHRKQKSAAAIMLAGEGQISIAVEAMRQGCSDYMTKAMMNVETLQKSIATALERRMMSAAMNEQQRTHEDVEASIRAYANASTAEMRGILSATLRRVRKLRSYQSQSNMAYSIDLNALETDIDRLWESLPEFNASPRVKGQTKKYELPSDARH